MRDTFSALRSLFAKVPTPYVGQHGSTGGGSILGGLGSRSKGGELAAYGHNGTLFAIVSNLAVGVSNAEWHLYRKQMDRRRRLGPAPVDRTEILSHQALEVWRRPNPFMWQQTFVETFQQHLDLTGLAFWAVERTAELGEFGRIPTAMWPVRPDRIAVVPDREDFIAGYVYTGPDGEEVPLGTDDVVMLRMPDPSDIYGGRGPLSAVSTDVDAAGAAAAWNLNFFRNSALPGGIIELDVSLSEPDWRKMVNRWRESHKGVNNAHRVGILEQGTWKDRTVSQKDMEFVQLRTMSRDVIREAYSYPEFLLGDMGDANRASAYAAEFVEARRLLAPRLSRIRGALNHVFLPMFGATSTDLEFDYDSPEPDDEEAFAKITQQKVASLVQLLKEGADPEQACELVGLPPIEIDRSQRAVPVAPGQPAAPGEDEDDDRPADPAAPPQPTGDPDDPEAVAARANDILRRNGLTAGILNGHARKAHR